MMPLFEREKRKESSRTITVRFTESELAELESLARRLGAEGRVGVIRRALAYFVKHAPECKRKE